MAKSAEKEFIISFTYYVLFETLWYLPDLTGPGVYLE